MGLFGSSFGQRDPQDYMMNIGQPQQPQNAWQMAMQPTQQQAAQSFQQQYGQPIGNMQAQALPVDPRAAQATKPGFFGKGGMGGKIAMGALGGIADGIARWGGAQPGYANAMQQQQEYAQRLQELQAEREARRAERMMPRAEQVGNAIGMLDPSTGSFTPTYTAPSASSLPAEAKDLQWWQSLSPEQQRAYVQYKDTVSPIAVAGPTGTFRVPRTFGGQQGGGRTVVKTGTDRESGRKIVQYSDGSIDYAD